MDSSSSDKKVFVLEPDLEEWGERPPLPSCASRPIRENGRQWAALLPSEIEVHDKLDLTIIVLPGISAEIPITVDITRPGADVSLKGIYLSSGTDKVSFNITVNHKVGGCSSRQLFNGIATGSAHCSFFGKIIVDQDAQKTEAYQENHNIVLSDDASVNTKPQLEIYADDVKCSHGATVGKLNEDEQFYMRSRGIPEDEAKVLQMISFVSPVLADLEDKGLAEKVENAIRSLAL